MSNPEHLKILKQGVETWNEWRQQNSKINPDLSSAHLNEAKLVGVDFHKVNLREANLTRADLRTSNLQSASLYEARVSGTNLKKANLQKTIFTRPRTSVD